MDGILLFVLAIVSFIGGIVTTSVGPGGIFVIAALYVFTGLSEAAVAGTSSVAFVLGAVIGSIAYVRSNEMDWRIALIIGGTGIVGTRIGIWANSLVSRQVFGVLLAVLLATLGAVTLVREYRGLGAIVAVDRYTRRRKTVVLGVIGAFIGVCSGLFGIGGAALSVPGLVLVGVSFLTALAVTQVIVVFLSVFTAGGYIAAGAVRSPLVFLLGGTYTVGCVAGWYAAHQADTDRLTVALGWSLLGLAPVLAAQAILL
jgi:uncharacterized membrane protein YfcA